MAKDTQPSKQTSPSFVRRALKLTLRTTITLAVIGAAGFAVQYGNAELARRAEAAPSPEPAPILPVTTREAATVSGYTVKRSFLGQIEPQKTVIASFELAGRLDSINFEEGDRIAEGDIIASLDTRILEADRARLTASKQALGAQLVFAEQTLTRRAELNTRGFASQAALDEANAQLDELRSRIAEVEASLVSNALQLEKSVITAPFSGVITERQVDGGESLAPGQPVLEIVQNGTPKLRIGVPLDIRPEDISEAQVIVDGDSYTARLITLRPDIDPVTRTRTALFKVDAKALAFGQTARLLVDEQIDATGLWVPATTLKEGVRGQWTLLGVDHTNTVRAISVQVQHTEGDRVFVSGAFPDETKLIVAGPQRVTVGQHVVPQPLADTSS